MKIVKLISLSFILLFSSCETGVKNPGIEDKEYFLSVGQKTWNIKKVMIEGQPLYILAPVDSPVILTSEDPRIINYKNGKISTATIQVN